MGSGERIQAMLYQLFLGSVLILASILCGALAFLALETALTRLRPWTLRPPHTLKLTLVLLGAVTVILGVLTASVWIWALAFLWLGVFEALEPAIYFSIVAFTTLGFGDVILPEQWRILGGMTAANGLLTMGLFTALLVEVLRRVRTEQMSAWGEID